MELSKRLFGVASLVTPGNRIADIGTDHAYIPIYLMEKNLAVSAVAMDVNQGPLLRAKEHVENAGLQEQIALRLSDGLEALQPYEADAIVVAGMGGGLMIRILSAYPEVTCNLKECVLQPQSEIAEVRAFLLQSGFTFLDEDMVLDGGKYYPMMKVVPPGSAEAWKAEATYTENGIWEETELRYGKLLLEKRHPVLKQFLEREQTLHEKILKGIEEKTGDQIERRKAELREDLYYIQKGLEYYAV